MTRVTMKVMITLITIAAPVDKVAEISSMHGEGKQGNQPLTKRYSHSSTHTIASGSVLQTPALVQVMVLGPVSESPLSHW